MTRFLFLLPLAAACSSDGGIGRDPNAQDPPEDGSIRGRVCDPSGRTWLSDAQAYTHIYNEDGSGEILETRVSFSDPNGYWLLDDLPPENEYTVFVQYGDQVLYEASHFVGDGDFITIPEPDCFDPLEVKVAVITGDYDNFDLVLSQMGFQNFTLVDGTTLGEPQVPGATLNIRDFLTDLTLMRQYDIIMFNGGHIEEDIVYNAEGDPDETHLDVMQNIRAFVEFGGSIYASDWSYDIIEIGWPDRVEWVGEDLTPNDAQKGEAGPVIAAIADEALADWLGKADEAQIDLDYDLPVWPPIQSVATSVSIHLRGDVKYRQGQDPYSLTSAPLLTSFNEGEGKVVYATFQVARNSSTDMLRVVQYMMYSL